VFQDFVFQYFVFQYLVFQYFVFQYFGSNDGSNGSKVGWRRYIGGSGVRWSVTGRSGSLGGWRRRRLGADLRAGLFCGLLARALNAGTLTMVLRASTSRRDTSSARMEAAGRSLIGKSAVGANVSAVVRVELEN
jgi:hypothetical protein